MSSNSEIAKTINSYFTNMVKSLEVPNSENMINFMKNVDLATK